jgi:hypothetical protein
MTTAGALALELTGGGDFDSLCQTFMAFLLRHLSNSFKRAYPKI